MAFALVPPLLDDFMLKSIGASCEPAPRLDDGGDDDDATAVGSVIFFSRNVDVVAAVEFDRRLTLLELRIEAGGCGDVGGVIDTTISSFSISSSSLFVELLSVGEHCDFKTASKYRFVNSSADLLPVMVQMKNFEGKLMKTMPFNLSSDYFFSQCLENYVFFLRKN